MCTDMSAPELFMGFSVSVGLLKMTAIFIAQKNKWLMRFLRCSTSSCRCCADSVSMILNSICLRVTLKNQSDLMKYGAKLPRHCVKRLTDTVLNTKSKMAMPPSMVQRLISMFVTPLVVNGNSAQSNVTSTCQNVSNWNMWVQTVRVIVPSCCIALCSDQLNVSLVS